jgi:hypothetical protein
MIRNNLVVEAIAEEQKRVGFPYNYFQVEATYRLLSLLGIDVPSGEQMYDATMFVENMERYGASKARKH